MGDEGRREGERGEGERGGGGEGERERGEKGGGGREGEWGEGGEEGERRDGDGDMRGGGREGEDRDRGGEGVSDGERESYTVYTLYITYERPHKQNDSKQPDLISRQRRDAGGVE